MLTQKRLLELAQAGLEKERADIEAMIGQAGTPGEPASVEQAQAQPGTRRRTVPVVRPKAERAGKTQAGRKTRTMTKAGRERIAAAQRKRWDAKRQLEAAPTNATPLPAA